MSTWIQLPADEVHSFYCVPLEVAAAGDNRFFGGNYDPRDMDGPWPFVAFLRNKDQLDVITLQIHTIPLEALYFEGFNPLTDTGGALSLSQQDLSDLANLLEWQAQSLPPRTQSSKSFFRRVEGSEIASLHLHPELFPRSRQDYYYQVEDPLAQPDEGQMITLLIFSTGLDMPTPLYFKIAQFPAKALQDPPFYPLDDAIARINLDHSGMLELASLLGSMNAFG